MPLAFLVERIGVACLADLWRIDLQCALPCKPFRLCPDAPLAHSIGTQAKQCWDKGETSLGSPPILRLAAFASASPLANQKWKCRDPPSYTTSEDTNPQPFLRPLNSNFVFNLLRRCRSDQDSSLCSTPPQIRERTPLLHRLTHRPQQARGAANSTQTPNQSACPSI